MEAFLFQNYPKKLDLSYKTEQEVWADLDRSNYFGLMVNTLFNLISAHIPVSAHNDNLWGMGL